MKGDYIGCACLREMKGDYIGCACLREKNRDYIGCACLMPLYYTDFCCFYDVVRWWFTIDRREADKLLMLPGNPRGTFLVRKSTGIYQWT